MTTFSETVRLKFTADITGVTAGLAAVKSQTATLAGGMIRDFGRASALVAGLFTKLTAVSSVVGGLLVKNTVDFESSLSMARTMATLTGDEVETLRNNVSDLMREFNVSDPTQAGGAVFAAFSTGASRAADQVAAATEMTRLAFKEYRAQGVDTLTTLYALASASNVFGEALGSPEQALDKLNAAVIRAIGTTPQMVTALADVVQLAPSVNATYEDMLAVLAVSSQRTQNLSLSSTQLSGVINALNMKTEMQAEAIDFMNRNLLEQAHITDDIIEQYGGMEQAAKLFNVQLVDFSRNAIDAAGGFIPWLRNILPFFRDMPREVRRSVRTVEGFQLLLALAQDEGAGLAETLDYITQASGTLEYQDRIMKETLGSMFKGALADVRTFSDELFQQAGLLDDAKNAVQGFRTEVVSMVTEASAWIEQNPEQVAALKDQVLMWGEFAVKVGGAAIALTVISPLLKSVALIVSGLTKGAKLLWTLALEPLGKGLLWLGKIVLPLLLTPLGWVVAGIVALGVVVWAFWDDIVTGAEWAWAKIKWFVTEVADFFSWLGDNIADFASSIYDAITSAIGNALDWAVRKWDEFIGLFTGESSLGQFFGFGQPPPLPAFQHGGYVSGPGGPDKVLARMTRGEYVLTPNATASLGPAVLAALNAAGSNAGNMARHLFAGDMNVTFTQPVTRDVVRDFIVPELERINERGLSPRSSSTL